MKQVIPRVSSENLGVGLMFMVAALLACMIPTPSDTWWLLRAGKEIWATWHVPLSDGYSHTARGMFWPNHEWLTELIFYAAYAVGGLPLLTAGCAGMIVATWRWCWRLMSGPVELRLVLFGLSIVAAATGWAVRPQLFSLFAVMLTCRLVLSGQLSWLPLIFVMWTNLHGAVAVGLVILAGALAGELVALRRFPTKLAITTVVCAAATLISPLGWRLWSFIPESMARSRADHLIEWLPPDWSGAMWPFWAIAALIPTVALLKWASLDRRRLTLLGMALGMLALAVQSRRNVSPFLLIGLPALSALLTPAGPRPPARPPRGEHELVNGFALCLAGSAVATFVALIWIRPVAKMGWEPISAEAVREISRCGTPLYNTYGTGGVLIWFLPDTPVFIDNRQDPFPTRLLQANYDLEMTGEYRALFADTASRAAVPRQSLVAGRLGVDPAWGTRFADSQWAVFVRSQPGNSDVKSNR